MLKALELAGFKSFADRTRFEFPSGITVIVGPNGSGKSNVVDAIRWVLGEQSARSLRGREMADVIFKGSGSGNATRKPANTAEATLVFDNADRRLACDAPEVRVTRRVYRSGEGEYLINGTPCRLRDVRDLFRGTGAGTHAYSLIEQGKVDMLLMASPHDRRAIFEEAAGISRFKAKQLECLRRLERVEQNLTRLADIVEEVEGRLKTIRSQATKARRYQEYSERLKQLRTQLARHDWLRYTDELNQLDAQQKQLDAQQSQWVRDEEQCRDRIRRVEQHAESLDAELGDLSRQLARLRQQIAGTESSLAQLRAHHQDLDQEVVELDRQYALVTSRAGDVEGHLRDLDDQLAAARIETASLEVQIHEHDQQLQQISLQEDRLRQSTLVRQAQIAETLGQCTSLNHESNRLHDSIATLKQTREEADERHRQLHEQVSADERRCDQLAHEAEALMAQLRQRESQSDEARHQLKEAQAEWLEQRERLADCQRQLATLAERATVLDGLEQRNEGISQAAQQLVDQARQNPLGPLSEVRGLVADLIRVDVSRAECIDAALGEYAQFVVVCGSQLLQQLAIGSYRPAGRLGIVSVALDEPDQDEPVPKFGGNPGVLGPANRFVESDPVFRPLVRRLLAHTWLVDQLATALRLHQQVKDRFQFVTLKGEIVDAQGAVWAGPRHKGLGIVSRRSQLRSLRHEIDRVQTTSRELAQTVDRLAQRTAQLHERTETLAGEIRQHQTELAQCQLRKRSAEQEYQQRLSELKTTGEKSAWCEDQQRLADQQLVSTQLALQEAESRLTAFRDQQRQEDQQMRVLAHQKHQLQEKITELKVQLAAREQRIHDLSSQRNRFVTDQQERDAAVRQLRTRRHQLTRRRDDVVGTILQQTGDLALAYIQVEQADRAARDHIAALDNLGRERSRENEQLDQLHRKLQQLAERRHQLQLESERWNLQREQLAARMKDDYGIELPAACDLDEAPETLARDRDEANEEINELRRKLNNLGAVNLTALDEIQELEARHQTLAGQYDDLVRARDSLTRIITRISNDSRRLFSETLAEIRQNFQTLFRRVFGGGRADIVLEEGQDILEAGVDIVATPPGKQSLSLSLLSGGERALTAVTLLLAVFQCRPSPFCVMDEVDGPLDEANIGRFLDVLREFLQWTRFVIVTHSKKTMTAAATLYGVTMQESGVSKRVSVRFEDVSDDGQIRAEAVERQLDSEAETGERGAA